MKQISLRRFRRLEQRVKRLNVKRYNELKKFLNDFLERKGVDEFIFKDHEVQYEEMTQGISPYICYDGGHHSEWASTMESEFCGFFKDRGKIFLILQDDDEYDLDRILSDDMYIIATVVSYFIDNDPEYETNDEILEKVSNRYSENDEFDSGILYRGSEYGK